MCHLKFLQLVLLFGTLASAATYKNFPPSVIEDAMMDAPQLLQKYGYPVETHYVTTEDQYILCLHRIPKPRGRPVLLMHGLLDSSDTWIMMGPWSSLGYYLHDNGYDVWMGNARGNRYSRNHTYFNPDLDNRFWTFSWHEIGFYDLPAMIDYVLWETRATKLAYLGHSQGNTVFWVMGSMRPEFNRKISIMIALAPAAFMRHIRTPLVRYRYLLSYYSSFRAEFLPYTNSYLEDCFQSQQHLDKCKNNVWQAVGMDDHQMDTHMWLVAFGHLPAGCNLMQLKHFEQLIMSDRFCQFDYGVNENVMRYGSTMPPDYPLERITAPVGLYYGDNDYLTSVMDVQRLSRRLPHLVDNRMYPNWNHISMIWGVNARDGSHKRMLNFLHRYTTSQIW